MIAQTLIGLIFVGVTPTSYGYSAPNVHDAPLGVQSLGTANPSLHGLLSIEQSTPTSPNGIKVPIFKDSDFLFATIIAAMAVVRAVGGKKQSQTWSS